MERVVFDGFWRTSFHPKALKLQEKYHRLKFDAAAADKIYNDYQDLRTKIHNYMLDQEGRIDCHKIGAAMVASILKLQPFTGVNPQTAYDLRFAKAEFMPNEAWAWHCALSVVLSFVRHNAKQKNDQATLKIFENGFLLPQCAHDTYEDHMFRSLYFARTTGKFDIFSFSHILFLIERYTLSQRLSAALS